MMLVGRIALSVEMTTTASAPQASAASATLRVPTTLVSIPSHGLASTSGTCFRAAAWKTIEGRSSPMRANMRSRSRTSEMTGRARPGWRPAISRSIS